MSSSELSCDVPASQPHRMRRLTDARKLFGISSCDAGVARVAVITGLSALAFRLAWCFGTLYIAAAQVRRPGRRCKSRECNSEDCENCEERGAAGCTWGRRRARKNFQYLELPAAAGKPPPIRQAARSLTLDSNWTPTACSSSKGSR